MLQGVVGGVMRTEIGVEVAHDSDAYRVAHGFDCTRAHRVDHAASHGWQVRSVVHASCPNKRWRLEHKWCKGLADGEEYDQADQGQHRATQNKQLPDKA